MAIPVTLGSPHARLRFIMVVYSLRGQMNMNRQLSRLAMLGTVAAMAVGAQAAILIDDFSVPFPDVKLEFSGSNTYLEHVTDHASIYGGSRDISFERFAGQDMFIRVGAGLGGARFQFASPDDARANIVLQWDGVDDEASTPNALNPHNAFNGNFAGYGALALTFRAVDAGLDSNNLPLSQLSFSVTFATASGTFTQNYFVNDGFTGTRLISLGDFAGADWANVQRFELSFAGNQGTDFTITNISVVPGPAALLPFAAGLLGVARRRRRAR